VTLDLYAPGEEGWEGRARERWRKLRRAHGLDGEGGEGQEGAGPAPES